MIVVDANALMMPVECNVRVFEELDRVGADLTDVGAAEARNATGDRTGGDADSAGTGDGRTDGDADSAEYVVPRAVLDELERLASGAGEAATAAGVGLDLAREHCRVTEHDADHGDGAVFECATREGVTAAVTNDKPLRNRLLDAGVPVISLRGANKLAVTRP